jgi:hypothetical protein
MKLTFVTFVLAAAGLLSVPSVFAAPDEQIDIESVCPQIHEVLPERLESAARRLQRNGIVEVRLTLRGDRIVEVMPLSGPVRYFAPVRAAVRHLHCRVEEAQEQAVFFRIVFIADD